jgi:hypothetical protein
MKKYVAALLVALGMLLMMGVPALAQPEGRPGGELQAGQSEKGRSPHTAPSERKPGSLHRSPSGDVHDTSNDATGRGELCGGI